MFTLLTAGCAGSGAVTQTESADRTGARDLNESRLTYEDARARLVQEVREWMGTPYRYGGSSENGVDCSAFVQAVLADALAIQVPRTTRAQMRAGSEVDRDELRAADLVFFRTPSRADHVGVYLGHGEFAHASTSSGVMISALDEEYWDGGYRSARRVAQLPDQGTQTGGTQMNDLSQNMAAAADSVASADLARPFETPKSAASRRGW